MMRATLTAATLLISWSVAAPAQAVNFSGQQSAQVLPDAVEVTHLKQDNAQRDEERLERHRDWEAEQQERREEEWEDEEEREEEERENRWENDRDDDYWSHDRDGWETDWDSDWDTDDRPSQNDNWFWNWNNRTDFPHDDDRLISPALNVIRLELTSATDDWITVSIEGLDGEQQLAFNQRNITQTINLPPGAYRISFRPTFSRSAWESGYLNVGQTDRIRIRFDQSRDRIQVYDDPYAWTSEAHSPIRIYSDSE